MTDLYRYFDTGGRLLYVGISYSAVLRLGQHRADKGWFDHVASVTIEKHADREGALEAERNAIRLERPLYNVAHAVRSEGHRTWSVPGNEIHIVRATVSKHRGHVALIVAKCPGCGRKHTHGVTPAEARRGWAHRFPHCGTESPWGRSIATPWQIIRFRRCSDIVCDWLRTSDPFARPTDFENEAAFHHIRDRRAFKRWLDESSKAVAA